jgi:fumarate reductase (CoM/CoB) subunit A
MSPLAQERADILVVGGGAAGCRAAIECAESSREVILASKFPLGQAGATVVAESFYAAPLGRSDVSDGPEPYLQDMIASGCRLCDRPLAAELAGESCDRVQDLRRYGVKFKEGHDGRLMQLTGPGHSHPRSPRVHIIEDLVITKILTDSLSERVVGAVGLDLRKGRPVVIASKAVIIATGGYSRIWSYNDVPCDCTGSGLALAYHAGADLVDMEMALFYPTVVIHPPILYGLEMPHGLLLEHVGGKLLNGRYHEFVPKQIPTRDVMVALIYRELARGNGSLHGGVYLDISKSCLSRKELRDRLKIYLPEKYRFLLKHGVDLAREPLEVAPMAHYTLGGVKIDPSCRTRVGGLLAAGEASGNVHGANRLAGNALPETQVFGAKAGEVAVKWARENDYSGLNPGEVDAEIRRLETFFEPRRDAIRPAALKETLQDLMWRYVGVERERESLQAAIEEIGRMKTCALGRMAIPPVREFNVGWLEALEVCNMLDLAEIVGRSALMREETRGHHFRSDFPERDDSKWVKHIVAGKNGEAAALWTEPVNETE